MKEGTCRACGTQVEWGVLCDACVDADKVRRLGAPPDHRRCRHCGAWNHAPGHSEFTCKKRVERAESL